MSATGSNKNYPAFVNILWIGLLTGSLDAIAAIAWNHKASAGMIFKFIASAVFGRTAFTGGTNMVLWGIFFHYNIAYIFTIIFYMMYPSFISIFRNKYLTGIVYGLVIWLIMNLIILPLSAIGLPHFHVVPTIIGIVILIICVGLPVSLIANQTGNYNKIT